MAQATATPGSAALFGGRREWSRELAWSAVAGLFLGLVGPFGSYFNASRSSVIAYWVAAVLFGAVLFGLTLRPAVRLAARLAVGRRLAPVWVLLVVLPLSALPMALASHTAAAWLWQARIGRIGFGLWYVQTLLISTPLAALHLRAAGGRIGKLAVAPGIPRQPTGSGALSLGPVSSGAPFVQRLPLSLGAELIALQMEDHYVRAHTLTGSVLILIPLHQAVAELAPGSGLRIHRSWWVAIAAVTGPVRDGRNLRLALANGMQAPVSRANVAAVRAAGLLADAG